MVVIRLARGGSKKKPYYHVVVADRRNARDGKYIERVGFFNPTAQGQAIQLQLSVDRIEHWQSVGAQASERVTGLMKNYQAPVTAPKPIIKAVPAAKIEQPTIEDAEPTPTEESTE